MDCADLAATGLDAGPLIFVGGAILLAGLLLMIVGRRRRGRAAVLVVLLFALGAVWMPGQVPSAQAAAVDCVVDPGPDNSLTIVQTSTMAGLAPNVPPAAIEGRVTNVSTDDTSIGAIVVSILSVTKSVGASAGTCDATDYVIVDPRMLVGQPLAAGASVTFSGASIGFANKNANQDACQGATVTLLYRTD